MEPWLIVETYFIDRLFGNVLFSIVKNVILMGNVE